MQSSQESTLLIRAVDASACKEVWYGPISGRVDKARLDAAAVAHAVGLAMQDFPARAAAPVII